jgi:DNA-binding NarL/FixJ family response regulator
MPLNILICDDHTLFREGLVALLERQAGWRVVGQAQDGDEALALAARLAPDVVVMDVAMPGVNGVDATAGILERSPSTAVIALSMYADKHYRKRMIDAGARGYVLKTDASTELVAAIEAAVGGSTYISPALAQSAAARAPSDGHIGLDVLTPRELEVFRLLALGHRPKVIAEALGIGVKTVESHRTRITLKLRTDNLAELIKIAIRAGVVELD